MQQPVRGGGHVDRAGVDPDHFPTAPVTHENVDLVQGFPDVLAIDPVNGVEAFSGSAGIHANAAHIARAPQQSKGVAHNRCCRHGCSREHTKNAAT